MSSTPWLRGTRLAALLLPFVALPALAQITLYDHPNYEGRAISAERRIADLTGSGLADRSSSAVVRGQHWEICSEREYRGRCRVLRPGQYPSLDAMGMDDQVRSVRRVRESQIDGDDRYAPHPFVTHDYRRRDRERLYEARVTQVRAVYGEAEQRCWIERGTAEEAPRSDGRVPGAVLGAVIGGILGHQVGGGSGRDLATAGGVVAGAVVGANLGRNRDGQTVVTRDVQRCRNVQASARPAYWDVDYEFRGQAHQVQLLQPPGNTLNVNRQGEPRVP